jgi:8-hydroxy-5-deazaflavin:NADPH oxidoreductase
VSQAFVGARLVKAFNHLPAAQLGTNPSLEGQPQAVFVSSNDAEASATVAAVATQLGFAPVELGRLDKGGTPLHVLGGQPGGLMFQNLVNDQQHADGLDTGLFAEQTPSSHPATTPKPNS